MNVPRLLAVSDRRALGAGTWNTWCRRLAAAGVPALQLREKDLDDRALVELAGLARECFPAPRQLLVNGRADLAIAAGADGVHLPASGLPVAAVRRVAAGRPLLVGRSTHDLDDVRRAHEEGADYVVFGPVFATPSKAGRLEPRGISSLRAATAIGVPVLAIGGVEDGQHATQALAAGAWGVAGIRAFLDEARAAELVHAVARRDGPT
jgi:thiamine-phosphate pyrophosphorylase